MAYFKIDDYDLSEMIADLTVTTKHIYNSKTNANGDTVVDRIASKRTITVKTIPMPQQELQVFLSYAEFNTTISFRNPETGLNAENVNVILPSTSISFYTIQDANSKVLMKSATFTFQEL